MQVNPKASAELRGQDLIQQIERLLQEAAPQPNEIIDAMELACQTVAELRALESRTSGTLLSAPRAAAVNAIVERLLLLHAVLAERLKKLLLVQSSAGAASSGSAGIFKPRF